MGHSSYALSGYRGKRRFSVYVPDQLAPEIERAVETGRELQALMKQAGLRYVRARKSERRHRVEMAGVYEMEHDAGVPEYFDQPPTIKLDYESPAGRRMGVLHTPDFFVIREKEAGWEEWKTEEELQRLTERNSNPFACQP